MDAEDSAKLGCYLEGKRDGIKEVVEWIEASHILCDPDYDDRVKWQAQLKEWGI